MRLAEDFRKAVVFLGEDATDAHGNAAMARPSASGFFVAWRSDSGVPVPDADKEVHGVYLITARHVADVLGANFLIKLNGKDGAPSVIEPIGNGEWHFHPDDTVDIAVLHYKYPDWSDCTPIPGRLLIKAAEFMESSDLIPNTTDVGIGDITYVVGLFRVLFGKKRNLPVVHTGHIALLPEDERIPVTDRMTGRRRRIHWTG